MECNFAPRDIHDMDDWVIKRQLEEARRKIRWENWWRDATGFYMKELKRINAAEPYSLLDMDEGKYAFDQNINPEVYVTAVIENMQKIVISEEAAKTFSDIIRENENQLIWGDTKYFTPSIEDIRVGYECEYMIGSQFTPFRFSTPYTALGSFSNMQAAIETGHVRVPYLTKEQIEREGWVFVWAHPGELQFRRRNNTIAFNFVDYSLLVQVGNENIFSYKGPCKDINTFRYICKLLNIK